MQEDRKMMMHLEKEPDWEADSQELTRWKPNEKDNYWYLYG